jgi:xanthosine utilization system XapX-like protein
VRPALTDCQLRGISIIVAGVVVVLLLLVLLALLELPCHASPVVLLLGCVFLFVGKTMCCEFWVNDLARNEGIRSVAKTRPIFVLLVRSSPPFLIALRFLSMPLVVIVNE